MINLYRNQQNGAVTLILTTLLLTTVTLLVIFAADYTMKQQKIATNQLRTQQAYEAAEAGLEFAIPYLKKNKVTILAYQLAGSLLPFSDSNTSNVTLANGGKYTITYSNPIVNSFQLIQITVTGTSSDGVASTTIKQLVQENSLLSSLPEIPVTTKQPVSLGGNSWIQNLFTNENITSGQSVTFSGNSKTFTTTGETSNASTMGPDIEQNNAAIQAMTNEQFFSTYMGTSSSNFKGQVSYSYANSTSTNYNATLAGKTGTSIWVEQTGGTATIDGNTTIGSAVSPVILVVNGNLQLAGNMIIYGLVVSIGGTISMTGKASIYGTFLSAGTGTVSMSGSLSEPAKITYDPTIRTAVQQLMIDYIKVPGSWRDY